MLRVTSGWLDSDRACALSDGSRHLGHIIRVARGWRAFDAAHLNRRRTGFKALGIYSDRESAKAAVEASCAMERAGEASVREFRERSAEGLWIS